MKYPVGIQTFSKLRNSGYLYIDKTATILDLVNQGEVYFFARPRRFGKSILISTLESLFSGEKHLFNDLAIADSDYDFQTYPVLRFDFSAERFDTVENLEQFITSNISFYAKQYNIELSEKTAILQFKQLIVGLYEKTTQPVVVLVDEYDKPILNNLNKDTLPDIKEVISAFYAVIKGLDQYLRFVFITGVTKFSKVSVFSGMNNLRDISIEQSYSTLCGVTEQELTQYFSQGMDELANIEGITKQALLTKVKYWYNGYRFHHLGQSVYNPLSLVMLFTTKEFKNFWFTTATPTFLIELMKASDFDLSSINHFEVDELFFSAIEPERMQPEPVLLQAGYLTIVDYNDGLYRLDFPNYEVKQAFNHIIVQEFGGVRANDMRYIRDLCLYLKTGEIDELIDVLKVFFANVPYGITLNDEKYYQSLFYAIFTLVGFNIQAEVQTNRGRIDCVVETDDKLYVIEFKLKGTKEQAIAQISDKQYVQKFQNTNKTLILLGIEFDQQTRNIGGFICG